MHLTDLVNQINVKLRGHGEKQTADELSPVSALRLNFDNLKAETTDEEVETKSVFGVPVHQFVPQRVISWIGNSAPPVANEFDDELVSNGSSSASTSNNNESCVSRKVWTQKIKIKKLKKARNLRVVIFHFHLTQLKRLFWWIILIIGLNSVILFAILLLSHVCACDRLMTFGW